MTFARVLIALAFVLVLGVPFALRPRAEERPGPGAARLVVVTPHVQQIRSEFGRAFSRWHERRHGVPAAVDWRTPGGTSEIRKQLTAVYEAAGKAALRSGAPDVGPPVPVTPPDREPLPELRLAAGSVGFDVYMGGGTFEHDVAKAGVVLAAPGVEGGKVRLRMAVPGGFDRATLDDWYGENRCGAQPIYDPEQFWLGTALSSFGIVYNRDVLRELGLSEPETFGDLCDGRYVGRLALADPRQSGSMTTTFDSILGNEGWEKGWRVLRGLAANARYFTNTSTKPPIDVSQGEAAAGLAIDFYGRSQAQAVAPAGRPEASRVGYTEPRGAVYVDADPVTILAGGPHPEVARRFVEFCLSEEAQALWQFPPRGDARSASNPPGEDGEPMGPREAALRRMPVRRVMYEKHLDHFIDQANPFELASGVKNPGWRTGVEVMMGAFAVDHLREARAAAAALAAARADPGVPPGVLAEMDRLFFAFPATRVERDGSGAALEFTEVNYRAIREAWRDPETLDRCRREYGAFFRGNYRRVVELGGRAPAAGR